ncbi:outspread isoform C [Danaus plexippus plexippus]|uniref:Outspread isoform C n=1 Tax=Danaus plexippus plexippus TaxID=278856 RepID=A0A212F1N2_DANPL|nr:outspread isoform C [Danaus plexippus plexippus]
MALDIIPQLLIKYEASRKISRCGYLFVAPGWDFSNPLYRTKLSTRSITSRLSSSADRTHDWLRLLTADGRVGERVTASSSSDLGVLHLQLSPVYK